MLGEAVHYSHMVRHWQPRQNDHTEKARHQKRGGGGEEELEHSRMAGDTVSSYSHFGGKLCGTLSYS